MVFLLVPFAVWFAWNVALSLLILPDWQQYLGATALSCVGAALVEPDHWYYGFGLVGVASLFMLIGDLLLVVTDWFKKQVLQNP